MNHIFLKVMIISGFLLIFVFTSSASEIEKEETEADVEVDDNDTFVATKEWQEVKEGQAIPPGLHVRMDLNKGGKWAKLMDDNKSNALTEVATTKAGSADQEKIEESDIGKTTDNPEVTSHKFEELKAALKKIKAEKIDSKKNEVPGEKSKFRSMEEIREAFEEFNLHEESDVEVMKRLVAVLRNDTASMDQKLLALQDLEYYVHQIDNANDLVTFGGFAAVVQTLNGTNLILKQEAAHVVGSAMQSNPKVQIEALRSGILRTLLLSLASTEYPMSLRKKCMYALSALVRQFPLAQTHFVQYGGFQIMLHLFNQNGVEPLQIKAIQLVHDLIDERVNTEKDVDDPQRKEKLKQYNRINLGKLINELGWCRAIASSLHHQQHNRREAVMRAMKVSHDFCQQNFRNSNVIDDIKKLKVEYKKLSDDDVSEGETESYYTSLHQLSSELLSLSRTRIKDEF